MNNLKYTKRVSERERNVKKEKKKYQRSIVSFLCTHSCHDHDNKKCTSQFERKLKR